MKRFLAVILSVMCAICPLTGCASSGGKDTLVLALRSGTYSEVIKGCLEDFEKEHSVTCEVVELSEDDLHSNVLNDSVNSKGEYDLCMVDGSWVSEYISEGVLTDLGELGYSFDDDIIPATTSICVQQGKTYLVPYYGNVTVMMYNSKAVADLGYSPDSFDSLADISDFCSAAKDKGYGGFAFRGDTENNIVVDFLPILCAYGGWVVDGNNNPTVNTPEFAAAMEYYMSLAGTGGALPKEELISSIEEGKSVIAVGWPGWYDDNSTATDYMAFPGKASGEGESHNSNIYGIWTLGIPANCTDSVLSCELLKYLMDKEVQKATVKDGGVPCRYSCLNDPELLSDNPHLGVICKALENGVYRPVIEEWPKFYTILGDNMKKIMAGEMSVADGLSISQEGLEAMMKEE